MTKLVCFVTVYSIVWSILLVCVVGCEKVPSSNSSQSTQTQTTASAFALTLALSRDERAMFDDALRHSEDPNRIPFRVLTRSDGDDVPFDTYRVVEWRHYDRDNVNISLDMIAASTNCGQTCAIIESQRGLACTCYRDTPHLYGACVGVDDITTENVSELRWPVTRQDITRVEKITGSLGFPVLRVHLADVSFMHDLQKMMSSSRQGMHLFIVYNSSSAGISFIPDPSELEQRFIDFAVPEPLLDEILNTW